MVFCMEHFDESLKVGTMHTSYLRNCLLYSSTKISKFLDFIHCMVLILFFITWQWTHSSVPWEIQKQKRHCNIIFTVLCKSNASKMSKFCSLFPWTFKESSLESSSDNLRPFERNFPGTKKAFSSNFWYKTKFHDEKHCFTNLIGAQNFT